MASCELCGRETELYRALVEGTQLNVCQKCGGFGKVLAQPRFVQKAKVKEKTEIIDVVVNDVGQRLKQAREKLGLTQKDFARRLSERESVIQKIETGHFKPSVETARKYEQVLKLSLVEKQEEVVVEKQKPEKNQGLTLGDFMRGIIN